MSFDVISFLPIGLQYKNSRVLMFFNDAHAQTGSTQKISAENFGNFHVSMFTLWHGFATFCMLYLCLKSIQPSVLNVTIPCTCTSNHSTYNPLREHYNDKKVLPFLLKVIIYNCFYIVLTQFKLKRVLLQSHPPAYIVHYIDICTSSMCLVP